MKRDEDMGPPHRGDEFQTDDEENQAERHCEHDYDSESDNSSPSPNFSIRSFKAVIPTWPQSYRKSMDMLGSVTPPPVSFLRGSDMPGITSSLSSVFKRRQNSEFTSFLSRPLVSHQSSDREEVPTSTLPFKFSAFSASSRSRYSINEFPSPHKESTFAQAVLNGTNILCGIGLLATPYAIKEGGWLSLLILLLFGILCCYSGTLLNKCLESSPGLQTYPDIGQAAFGMSGRLAISENYVVYRIISCVEYVIMMSDNLSTLFPNTFMSFGGIHLDSHKIFALTATVIVLPTVWLRDLSFLSYLSVGGVGASILVAFCLLWVGVVDKVGFHQNGTALNLEKLPFAIGIYGYGFSGHAVFPNIYSSMKELSSLTSVLIVSFIFCSFMYTIVSICGFLMFGDSIKSQYTLNMPIELVASNIAVCTAVVNPMTKYALTITPVALSLEELMPSGGLRSYSVSLIIRTVLVISTLVVAVTFPFFGFVMAFIGSSLAMIVAVIFPCTCCLRILRERLTKLQIVACVFTITVGVLTACIGTYSSIVRVANNRMEHEI